eukprot:4857296-Amphidinium_carterae.1
MRVRIRFCLEEHCAIAQNLTLSQEGPERIEENTLKNAETILAKTSADVVGAVKAWAKSSVFSNVGIVPVPPAPAQSRKSQLKMNSKLILTPNNEAEVYRVLYPKLLFSITLFSRVGFFWYAIDVHKRGLQHL